MQKAILVVVSLVALLALPAFGQEACKAALPHFEQQLGIDVTYGCLLEDIQPGSLAEQQGLARRDLVVSMNGKDFRDFPSTKEFALDTRGAAASDRAILKVLKFNGHSYNKNPQVVQFTMSPVQLTERIALGFKCKGQAVVLTIDGDSPLRGTDIRAGDIILEIAGTELSGFDPEHKEQLIPKLDNPLMIDQVVNDAFTSEGEVMSFVFGRWTSSDDGIRRLDTRLVVLPKTDLLAHRK